MSITATEKVDLINIGLMLASACIAVIMPFELFLLVYAILGPLHYLTEISWLHDKRYFTKGKYDPILLLVVGVVLMLVFFRTTLELEFPRMFDANLMFIAVVASLIFVTIKSPIYKIGGIIILLFASQVSHNINYLLTVFVPTLIHVYVFTALFIIYGAIKSKSRFGLLSVLVMISIPVLLFNIFPNTVFFSTTDYAREVYAPFRVLNRVWFSIFHKIQTPQGGWDNMIFNSGSGIMLMRFIAFAYTYHYLNWFSKTKVIQWHNVPKMRFIVVIVVWLISIALYVYNYMLGLQWLLFLSFMHVLLELPLNFISMIGIGGYIKSKLMNKPQKAKA